MPHIQINSSTPETRRRELLLKSLRINEIFKLALEEAKLVIRSNIENKKAEDLSYAEQYSQSDIYELNSFLEYTTILPPMDCVGEKLLLNEDEFKDQLLVSTIVQEFHDYKKELSMTSTYRPNLVSDDDVDSRECKPHFITCLSMDPNFAISSHGRRHRTSSLPNSTMIFSLSASTELSNHRCTNLGNLTLWQNNPQQIIYLFNRQYHCQPMSKFDINKFLLANSKHIDIYNIQTGCCDEKMCFQSSNINYIAICYNKYKDELFVASTSSLYIYNLLECKVNYEIHLPGFPFSLDHNDQVRYLVCNSSSIYHGYFSFTPTCTSTVLSRLSQFEFRHVCDLEFDDGTMHGIHAFENYIGIAIRYGRYSSRQYEDYCLYIYDSLLDKEYYHIDLNDIGCITCLTGYERTLDWILCDYTKQQILFVNQQSIEIVQYSEVVNQCLILDESNHLAVWLSNRIFIYKIE